MSCVGINVVNIVLYFYSPGSTIIDFTIFVTESAANEFSTQEDLAQSLLSMIEENEYGYLRDIEIGLGQVLSAGIKLLFHNFSADI